MGLFGFGKKQKFSLDDMIAFAEECKRRKLTTLEAGEVKDCVIYNNDHWEIQFLIGAPEKLIDVLSQGRVVNTSFSLYGMEYRGVPFVAALFRFDNNYQLSYGGITNPGCTGEPGTELSSLNYFDILLSQPEISYIQKGKTKQYRGKIRNPLQNSPQLKTLQTSVDAVLSKRDGYSHYFIDRNNLESGLRMNAMANTPAGMSVNEQVGQTLWDNYEASL